MSVPLKFTQVSNPTTGVVHPINITTCQKRLYLHAKKITSTVVKIFKNLWGHYCINIQYNTVFALASSNCYKASLRHNEATALNTSDHTGGPKFFFFTMWRVWVSLEGHWLICCFTLCNGGEESLGEDRTAFLRSPLTLFIQGTGDSRGTKRHTRR